METGLARAAAVVDEVYTTPGRCRYVKVRDRRLFGEEVAPVEGRYLEALTRALPELSKEEVEFRYRAMVGLLALHQAGTLTDLVPGRDDPATKPSAEARRLRQTARRIFTP